MKKKPVTKRTTVSKSTSRSPRRRQLIEDTKPEPDFYPLSPPTPSLDTPKSRSFFPSARLISLAVLVIALIILFVTNRGFFVAALVNGQPVFRWNLTDVLTKRYGTQTLEGIITEKLIADEASKQSIKVSAQDIQARETEILSSFGSSLTVEDFLRLQGINKTDFENQLKLQIMVQRLLTKDVSITDADVDSYIATNRATLIATEPAKLKEEAKQAIIDTKVGERIDEFLQTLRSKATIRKFL